MDGFESVRRYRAYEKEHFLAQHGRLFVVGTSANIDGISKQAATAAGMDAFIDKPFNYENIVKVVTSEVGARALKPRTLAAATPLPAGSDPTAATVTTRVQSDVRGL